MLSLSNPEGVLVRVLARAVVLCASAAFVAEAAGQTTAVWSGCYAGAYAGAYLARDHFASEPAGAFNNPSNGFSPGNRSGLRSAASSSIAQNDAAPTVGGQFGCNLQMSHLVLGLEFDAGWGGERSGAHAFRRQLLPNSNPPPNNVLASRTETYGVAQAFASSIRARLGYSFDRLLLYATAGLAIAYHRTEAAIVFGGDGFFLANYQFAESKSYWNIGPAAGFGAEHMLDSNWSIKAEYLYAAFKTNNIMSSCQGCTQSFLGQWLTQVRPEQHSLRVGLNYRF